MEQKNKIIIFSNIKGGVGKTTLCSLLQLIWPKTACL